MSDRERRVAELVKVATAMLRREMHPVLGARRITALCSALDLADDDIVLPIRGFEPETDDYVRESLREGFAQEYLRRVDERIAAYVAADQDSLDEDCRNIVARFSKGSL